MSEKPEKEKEEKEKSEEEEIEKLIIEYDAPNEPDPEKLFLDTYAKIKRIADRYNISYNSGDIVEATTLLLKLKDVIDRHKQQLKGEKNRRLALVVFALVLTNYITNLDDLVFLLTLMEKMYGLYPKGDKSATD